MAPASAATQTSGSAESSGSKGPLSFQGLILRLQNYWAEQGCVILQPYDMEVGAGTFHPATTLRALGPQPWRAAYEQAIKASHIFNTLQARGVISVAERQAYIGRVRDLAKGACAAWMDANGWAA